MIYFLQGWPFMSMTLASENEINARTNIEGSWGLKSAMQGAWETIWKLFD